MSKKQIIYFIIGIVILWLWIELSSPHLDSNGREAQVIFPYQGLKLIVEIAETEKQRAQGLMFRSSLAVNRGMLFVFEQENIQKVWMKNTLIALDVVFLSEKGKVVSINQGLKPCMQEPCIVYESNKKAKFMLEVNAGVIDNTGIRVGQKFHYQR